MLREMVETWELVKKTHNDFWASEDRKASDYNLIEMYRINAHSQLVGADKVLTMINAQHEVDEDIRKVLRSL